MRRFPVLALATLALATLALAACKPEAPAPAQDPLSLLGQGVEWRITEIAGNTVPDNVTVTLSLPEAGRVAGSSGCNRYAGQLESRDGALQVGALVATRMMCGPAQMQVEQAFHSTIDTAKGVRLVDGALEITDAAGKVVLRARR